MNFVHSKSVQTLIHNYKLPIYPKGGQSRTFNQATVYDALSLKYRKAIIVARSVDYGYFNIESRPNQWGEYLWDHRKHEEFQEAFIFFTYGVPVKKVYVVRGKDLIPHLKNRHNLPLQYGDSWIIPHEQVRYVNLVKPL